MKPNAHSNRHAVSRWGAKESTLWPGFQPAYRFRSRCNFHKLRGYFSKILISPVGTSTVGCWNKALFSLSGIDTIVFKAHSTRRISLCQSCGHFFEDRFCPWNPPFEHSSYIFRPSKCCVDINVCSGFFVVSTIALKSHGNRKYVTAVW